VKIRSFVSLAVLTFLAIQVVSCDAVNISPDDSGVNGGDDGTIPPPDDGGTDGGDTAPTLQDEAVQAAIDSAEAVAQAVAAILPTKDLQAIFEFGMQPPTCPSLGTELQANDILLTLDYGTGCGPDAYPQSLFEGIADGIAYIAFNAFDFEFGDFAVDGDALTGSVAGSFSLGAGAASFSVNLDLTIAGGGRVTGTASIEVDDATGAFVITEATLSVTAAEGDVFGVTLEGAMADPASAGSFVPEAGAAAVDLPPGDPQPSDTAIELEFTAQTPVDGTVTLLSTP